MDILVDVVGYEGLYKINKNGDVWSCGQRKVLMKQRLDKDGYLRANLYKNQKPKTFHIHQLLATQFIPNPDNLLIIDHIDRNKTNNNLENLRWTTHKINNQNRCPRKTNKLQKKNIRIWINQSGVEYWRVDIKSNGFLYIQHFRKEDYTLEQILAIRNQKYIEFGLEICD